MKEIIKSREQLFRFARHTALVCLLLACAFLLPGVRHVRAEEETETEAEAEVADDGVYNLLLVGSDRRADNWNGNSDVVILITINDSTQRIVMTSFMRDLYADIPGYGVHKLNYAYAVSGAELLIETLELGYDLSIDNYAAVDFISMADIIDLLGGVEMEVSSSEAKYINENAILAGSVLPGGGTYLLDGAQAVAYMRIRYVGNSDYERTERQRSVLSVIFEKLKTLGAAELAELAGKIFAMTDSDIDALELMKLMTVLPRAMDYELVTNRVPYDGMYTSKNEMLVPDFEKTIERLHAVLFGYGDPAAAE